MNTHSKQVGRECHERAKTKWGNAWRFLSDEQKQGAVAVEILSVLMAQPQDRPELNPMNHVRDVAISAMAPWWPDEQTSDQKPYNVNPSGRAGSSQWAIGR